MNIMIFLSAALRLCSQTAVTAASAILSASENGMEEVTTFPPQTRNNLHSKAASRFAVLRGIQAKPAPCYKDQFVEVVHTTEVVRNTADTLGKI